MSTIQFVYIYCSRLGLHGNWIRYYNQIQGVFNDSLTLGEKIKYDLELVYQSQTMENNNLQLQLTTQGIRTVKKKRFFRSC